VTGAITLSIAKQVFYSAEQKKPETRIFDDITITQT